jgi:hypothetical protein
VLMRLADVDELHISLIEQLLDLVGCVVRHR